MVLPLTTAVTQVVMLRAGELAVGVPANLVEIVRRTSAQDRKRLTAPVISTTVWRSALLLVGSAAAVFRPQQRACRQDPPGGDLPKRFAACGHARG